MSAVNHDGFAARVEGEYRFVTEEEFQNDRVPDAVIERLAHEGTVSLNTGASKAGKSFFSTQAAMCVATGTPFLGLQVERAPVLYISLEMIAALMRFRMEAISRDVGISMPRIGTDFFLIAPTGRRMESLSILEDAGRERLRNAIRTSGAHLVVLDTFHRFALGADPNDNAQMSLLFAALNEDAHDTRAAFLVLDHVAKSAGENGYTPSTTAIGAQSKGASSSSIIALKRLDTARGGTYEIRVESHFDSWDEPLTYRRPMRADGTPGAGCVVVGAAEAKGLDVIRLHELFTTYGAVDCEGRRMFPSLRKLRDALQESGMSSGNSSGEELIRRIERQFGSTERHSARPVWITGTKPRRYTWLA